MDVPTPQQDQPTRLSDEDVRQLVIEVLKQERENLQAKLVEQEHRLVQVVWNLYEFRKHPDAEMRRAAWRALIWKLFAPRATTVAIVTGGLFTLALTGLGLIIALRANALLDRQVMRMDAQNLLTEAQRRTTFLTAELTSIPPRLTRKRNLYAAVKLLRQVNCSAHRLQLSAASCPCLAAFLHMQKSKSKAPLKFRRRMRTGRN